jgi:hypothetical protein
MRVDRAAQGLKAILISEDFAALKGRSSTAMHKFMMIVRFVIIVGFVMIHRFV